MRFLRQSLIGLVLAALSLGLLAYAGSIVGGAVQDRLAQETNAPPARERVFAVGVVQAQPGTETPVLEAFGEVQSRRTLELRAAVSGRVIELADGFEDGGDVTAGQVLVRIDPANAKAALARAEADMMDAEAEVRDADRALVLARDEEQAAQDQTDLRMRAFRRQKDLAARGVGTAAAVEEAELAAASARQAALSRRQAVTTAEARIDQAQTRLARARIALDEAQRTLNDTTVIAPFDGTLTDTDLVAGRLVSANEQLATLIDPRALEVAFRVSTAQFSRLLDSSGSVIDAPVTAILDVVGIDMTATGTVNRASAGGGDMQTGRLVFARLGSAVGFKPGDFVTVVVSEPPLDNVVRLPASAIDANDTVLVLEDDNRLASVPVTVLRRQGDDVLVRSADILGRDVVEARSPLLGAGISVRPLRPQEADTAPAEPEMVELTDERRARLVAFVEANQRMPADAKERVLARLAEARVPARMVARLESRMGG
ncbi:HlyD family efflux transporter periplasmic adaptor subunit [uncultured Tateyamaria sp.]|uniref:efflux RND transporter periplasmic adaptor subunit n=1 Tax=uncultured Tateyamaria sp. TaxID=455651 RepID=UPI00261A2EDA|nr:HlyD family efflux transporter periplasmic adaptor subunit [uncultured Tateyamaria sp.]